MNRTAVVFATLSLVLACALFAIKTRHVQIVGTSSWMTVKNLKKPDIFSYFAVSTGGEVIYRYEDKKTVVTKKTKINKQTVSDFFREAENAKSLIEESSVKNKLLFYRGDILEISLYIEGALRRISAPLVNYGEAFLYAFNQMKGAVEKAKSTDEILAFLTAEPLAGEKLDSFMSEAGKDYEFELIETKKLKECGKLLDAVKQPFRMLPLATKKEVEEIVDFIKENEIYGLKNLFYISTTRGKFKCRILPARREPKKEALPKK